MSDFGATGDLIPDLAEPIRAYRVWRRDEYRLVGVAEIGEPTRAEPWNVPVPRKTSEPKKAPATPVPEREPVPA